MPLFEVKVENGKIYNMKGKRIDGIPHLLESSIESARVNLSVGYGLTWKQLDPDRKRLKNNLKYEIETHSPAGAQAYTLYFLSEKNYEGSRTDLLSPSMLQQNFMINYIAIKTEK
jgi:hypothetical protein